MKHASLFSGIGGFDLAAQWMGWENELHCEIADFPRQILKYYWPNAKSYTDITQTDFTPHHGTIDILSGGFPCQPFSLAGKRKGTADSRHLWPEMLRAIKEIAPRWVVGENVYGIVNWSKGLVFEQVQADLESAGYQVWPLLLPACGVGAPHKRDRFWFIAYAPLHGHRNGRPGENRAEESQSKSQGHQRERVWNDTSRNATAATATNANSNTKRPSGESREFTCNRSNNHDEQEKWRGAPKLNTGCCDVLRTNTHTNSTGSKRSQEPRKNRTEQPKGGAMLSGLLCTDWEEFPTQSPVCGGDDGFSTRLDFATVFEGIDKPRKPLTFGKWRNESIKGYGNAIVPQVALQIFKAIDQYEKLILE